MLKWYKVTLKTGEVLDTLAPHYNNIRKHHGAENILFIRQADKPDRYKAIGENMQHYTKQRSKDNA